jgi:hypothetical protein
MQTHKPQRVDPADLEISPMQNQFVLRVNGQPIALPSGNPLLHPRLSLLEHIREEFSGFGFLHLDKSNRVVKPDIISSYALLATQRQLEAAADHVFVTQFRKWLLLDPMLRSCAGPELTDQMARWRPVLTYVDESGLQLPSFPQIPIECDETDDATSILRKLTEPMLGDNPKRDEYEKLVLQFLTAVEADFITLGLEEQTVIFFLCRGHGYTLFPMMLATGRCTASQYANAVMAAECRLVTAFPDVNDKALAELTRNYREDAQIALNFLQNARSPWHKDIAEGENEKREFKSTLRFDLKTKLPNPELEHAVLKNIAAFLNTNGGTIFVGVGDTGEVVGIERDDFPNNDKWSLHLVTRIAQQLGAHFAPYCQIEFDKLMRRSVCRITIQPSPLPAFFDETALKKKGEKQAFYIRGGPSAQKLDAAEAESYLVTRFPNPKGQIRVGN